MGGLAMLEVFALLGEATKAFPGMSPDGADVLREHLLFLYGLEDQGKLMAAGALDFNPDLPGGRAMVVVRAASREEAEQIGQLDPLVRAGWLTYSVHAWQVNEGCLVDPLRNLLSGP